MKFQSFLLAALCLSGPAAAQTITYDQARAAAETIAAYVTQARPGDAAQAASSPPPSAPQPVTAWPKASLPDVLVAPGKGKAVVRLSFAEPLPASLSFRFNTINVTTTPTKAWEGGTYARVQGTVTLPAGTREYTWDVPLHDMREGWKIGFQIGWHEGTPSFPAISTTIRVGTPVSSTTPAPPLSIPQPPSKLGRLLFETDFKDLSTFDKAGGLRSPTPEHAYINEEGGRYQQPGDDLGAAGRAAAQIDHPHAL